VSQRLGHSSIVITLKHYARLLPGFDDVLADQAQELLAGDRSS
jgi:hypothetical protein